MLLNYLYFCFTTLSYYLILQQLKQLYLNNSSARNNTARGRGIYIILFSSLSAQWVVLRAMLLNYVVCVVV